MFKPAALFIGLRYTRAKRRNHFISFISMVSMIGIALGIVVLITVLSVMNGFDQEIEKRVFTMVPPVTVSSYSGNVAAWQGLEEEVKGLPYVTGVAPFATGEVLINYGGNSQPALINGVLPAEEKQVSLVETKMVRGQFTNLVPGQFGIILGQNLADLLQVDLGDKVTVVTPQVSLSPAGVTPRFKRFTVVGIFRAGGGFGFDRGLSYIHLNDAQRLLGLNDNVTGLHLNVKNPFNAPFVAEKLRNELNASAAVSTWVDQFGEFFKAVQLEKKMMFLILILIIAVAAFNLVSTLIMVVSEKESDIAILRTFGATPAMIMGIFIIQGGLIGLLGTILGTVAGIALAYNVTGIVNWIEQVFHIQFMSSNVYFVNYLPSKVELHDILVICAASLFLSLLATLYPAWRASKLDPVESLRYE